MITRIYDSVQTAAKNMGLAAYDPIADPDTVTLTGEFAAVRFVGELELELETEHGINLSTATPRDLGIADTSQWSEVDARTKRVNLTKVAKYAERRATEQGPPII